MPKPRRILPRPIARAKHILASIIDKSKPPDIIFLQEVTTDVRKSILENPIIRKAFLVTSDSDIEDSKDQALLEEGAREVPSENMTLLSSERFLVDSSEGSEQCARGLDASNSNSSSNSKFTLGPISSLTLPRKYARRALHGKDSEGGATWGVGVERRDGLGPKRLDKVALLGAVEVKEMEILRPGLIEVPKPGKESDFIPWSDHCGIRVSFEV